MEQNYYFRAGVGAVVYNQDGEVALFRRAKPPVGIWQFCQGGIQIDDSIEDTLWQELQEETGIQKSDISTVHELPHWTIYQDPTPPHKSQPHRLGQVHRWFFLALAPEVTIDLHKATDQEFSDYCWCTWADAIAQTSEHKRHVYEQLSTHFQNTVVDS